MDKNLFSKGTAMGVSNEKAYIGHASGKSMNLTVMLLEMGDDNGKSN